MIESLILMAVVFCLGYAVRGLADNGRWEVQRGRKKAALSKAGLQVFQMHPRGTEARPGWAQVWPRG